MHKSQFKEYLGFDIPAAVSEYAVLRRKFYDLAWFVSEKFKNDYSRNFPNIDVLIDKGTVVTIEYLKPIVRQAVEELVKIGIYDVNIDYFIEQYILRYFEWDLAFNVIFDRYAKICLDESETRQFREDRKNNRSRWGVLTTSDKYFEAQIEKGVLNLYDGIGHSIRNAIGNAISKSVANAEKNALFSDKKTMASLTEAVFTTCFNIHYALVDALNDNRDIKLPDYQHFISVAPTIKRMIENLNNDLIPAIDVNQVICKVLNANPFEIDIYDYLLKSGRNTLVEVSAMTDELLIDTSCLFFGSSTNEILSNLDSQSLKAKEKLYLSLKKMPITETKYDEDRVKIMNQCLTYEGTKYDNFDEIQQLINPTSSITMGYTDKIGISQSIDSNLQVSSSTLIGNKKTNDAIIKNIGCGYLIMTWVAPWLGIILYFKWRHTISKQILANKILKYSIIFLLIQILLTVFALS